MAEHRPMDLADPHSCGSRFIKRVDHAQYSEVVGSD